MNFSTSQIILFSAFTFTIILFLVVDLGFLNKIPRKISGRSALQQTLFWIAISVAYGILVYIYGGGSDVTLQYFSAYLTEKALSLDNIFVIILILKYFKIQEKHYHKILFWGIMGAIVFRAVFIFVGAFLVSQFHWILYIFGAFLVYSGVKIIYKKEDEDQHPEKNPIIKLVYRFFKVTHKHNGQFFLKRKGQLYITNLFLVLILVETTDLIFAVDSIPAAFAITTNQFVIFTSNIFAVMGLRAMFFLLAGVLDRFYLLQKALSLILVFIGVKMLLEIFSIGIPTMVSFIVIILSLTLSIVFSMIFPSESAENVELEAKVKVTEN